MDRIVETLIEDERWENLGLEALADDAARATLRQLRLYPDQFEISLLACDDARIAALNADFRGEPRPTNVLSWPETDRRPDTPGGTPDLPVTDQGGPPEGLGDIAIAYDTCQREAAGADRNLADHVTHLIVHSVLHLLGYDHITDQDAALMERIEGQTLAQMGLPDPYRTD